MRKTTRQSGFWILAGYAGLLAAVARGEAVAPAPTVRVEGEEATLSPDAPHEWARGTKLRQVQTLGPGNGTPAQGSVVIESIVVRHEGRVLAAGKDYLVHPVSGSLGIAPGASVAPNAPITIDYTYRLRRLDSRIRTAGGKEEIRPGEAALTVPEPPALGQGEVRLANLFVDYGCDGTDPDVYPIQESADQARTATTPGRIPKTLARIAAGEPVKIVCWGDSVTVGGDVSGPEWRYPAVLGQRLKAKYPGGKIEVETIAVGGSHSRQWLWPEKFPGHAGCDWERVAAANPDLVTLEFVNDASLSGAAFEQVYDEIAARLKGLEAEWILITPHFTKPEMMGFKGLREGENRPYVLALRAYAQQHNLALADASARWEHLWKEGLPYVTLLRNGINHPDDRGHALFADELMKCFDHAP
ncbi:MAG: SGNH/GDSL hydrolase family protein [Thermoguttaceae bacterium]